MKMVPVDSSMIQSVGYDESFSILYVEFNNGSVYQYSDVPKELHTRMMNADSVGRFLNANIKGNYTCEKM